MNLMDNLAAEKKAAQSILAKGMDNVTEKEQEELKQHYAAAKKLQERIDLFKEAVKGSTSSPERPRPSIRASRRRPSATSTSSPCRRRA